MFKNLIYIPRPIPYKITHYWRIKYREALIRHLLATLTK